MRGATSSICAASLALEDPSGRLGYGTAMVLRRRYETFGGDLTRFHVCDPALLDPVDSNLPSRDIGAAGCDILRVDAVAMVLESGRE